MGRNPKILADFYAVDNILYGFLGVYRGIKRYKEVLKTRAKTSKNPCKHWIFQHLQGFFVL